MSLTMYVRMRRKFSLTSATKVTFVCMFRKRLIFRVASKILFCCRWKMWVHRSKKEERKKGISCSSNLIVHRDECLPFLYKYAYIHTVYTQYMQVWKEHLKILSSKWMFNPETNFTVRIHITSRFQWHRGLKKT